MAFPFFSGALNRRLQTFLPRSTPRTEILIPIPIPPPENAGERTSPEGGAGHYIKSARVRTGSTGRRLPLLERERIKRQTIANRRLQHQLLARTISITMIQSLSSGSQKYVSNHLPTDTRPLCCGCVAMRAS